MTYLSNLVQNFPFQSPDPCHVPALFNVGVGVVGLVGNTSGTMIGANWGEAVQLAREIAASLTLTTLD